MCNKLEALRAANPELKILSVFDPEFKPYGTVLSIPEKDKLAAAVAATPIPESGVVYVADEPALREAVEANRLQIVSFGDMPIQTGYCNGRGYSLDCLEYHKCSEVNFSTTGVVLMMALPSDIIDGKVDSSRVVCFYLPPMVAVEVLPLVMHYAPCRVEADGFNCMVVLEKNVNTPLDSVNSAAEGEEAMLWMRNKWLISHPDAEPAKEGAYVGITGKNLQLMI